MKEYSLVYGIDVVCEHPAVTNRDTGMITFIVGKECTGKSTLTQLEAWEVLTTTMDEVYFVNPSKDVDYSVFEKIHEKKKRVTIIRDDIATAVIKIIENIENEPDKVRWIYFDDANSINDEEQEKLYLLCQMASKANLIISIVIDSMRRFIDSGTYPKVMWGYIRNYMITELDRHDELEKQNLFYMDQSKALYQYAANKQEWHTFENIGVNGRVSNHKPYVDKIQKRKAAVQQLQLISLTSSKS